MRLFHIALLAVITISAAWGQTDRQDWTPEGIHSLGRNASSRTEFALDHSMLVLASKLDQDDDSLRRVIAGVDGVSVRSYGFARPGMYDSKILTSVRQQYHAAGWSTWSALTRMAIQGPPISGSATRITPLQTSRFCLPDKIISTSFQFQVRSVPSTSFISRDISVSPELKAESSSPCQATTGSGILPRARLDRGPLKSHPYWLERESRVPHSFASFAASAQRRFWEDTPDAVWQKRFYDFSVWSEFKRIEKLRYMHRNPVKRGLVEQPDQWKWSSFRTYFYGERGPVRVNFQEWKSEIKRSPPQKFGSGRVNTHPHIRKRRE